MPISDWLPDFGNMEKAGQDFLKNSVEEFKNSMRENWDEVWELIKDKAIEFFDHISIALQESSQLFMQEMINFILMTPTLAENVALVKIWTIVRIISFVLIGAMFVWEGFKKVISVNSIVRSVEFKEMFTRMIYGLILAIFSLDMIDLIIIFDNVLVDAIRKSFPIFINNDFQTMGWFSFVMVSALVITQIVLGIKLILQYWMRIAEMWLMAVMSPLMYTLWIHPNWGGYLSSWFRRLTTLIFVTFFWSLLLALYSSMVSIVSTAGSIVGFTLLGPIASVCLSIALLLLMINTQGFVAEHINSQQNALAMMAGTAKKIINTNKKANEFVKRIGTKIKGWRIPKHV